MIQTLQLFRIGVINLFGITVPGFLMLMFLLLGLFIPGINIATEFSDLKWQIIFKIYSENTFIIIFLFIILSYILGYILRLSSPDDLDKISAKKVLKRLTPKEQEVWPYTDKPYDKFPYYNFGEYLKARDLEHLLEHVKWGDETDNTKKRSKTVVNIMKIDIMHNCSTLYSFIEANEAHIRLLSGTWLAIKDTRRLILCSAIIYVLFILYIAFLLHLSHIKIFDHIFFCLTLIFVFFSISWAKKRIENLFHYRRVNELLSIVHSAYIARKDHHKNSCQE